MLYGEQRHRCCAFDSPGLPNDSAGYPGLGYGLWRTTPSVLRFFNFISCQKEERRKGCLQIDEPHRGSAFDSPRLPNDSAGYPGLICCVGHNAIGVAFL